MPSLLITTNSIKDVYRSILITSLGHIESMVTQSLYGSQVVGGQPAVINAERGV
jgi:hypothetical protein